LKPAGHAIIACVFAVAALVTYAIMQAVHIDPHRQQTSLALIVASLAATSLGAAIWRREAPDTPLMRVQALLGATLAVTSVAVSLAMQWAARWMAYPEIAIPVAAVGCFVYPFFGTKRVWEGAPK